jgi:hypothetical protein
MIFGLGMRRLSGSRYFWSTDDLMTARSDAWSNGVAFARLKRYAAPCLGTGLRSSEQPSVECRT